MLNERKHWYQVPNRHTAPDGRLALGTVIKDPMRPFASLAHLQDHMALPETSERTEERPLQASSGGSSRSASIFAKALKVVSFIVRLRKSHEAASKVEDLDLRMITFKRGFDMVEAEMIGSIPEVEPYMRGFRRPDLCRIPVFVITSLLIARSKAKVVSDVGDNTSMYASGNAEVNPTPVATVAIGGHASCSNEASEHVSYVASNDIVIGFEVDIIRPGLNGLEAEAYFKGASFACAGQPEDDGGGAADESENSEEEEIDEQSKLRCLPLTPEELRNIPNRNIRFNITELDEGGVWIEFEDDSIE